MNGQGPPGGAPMSGGQQGMRQQQAGNQEQQLIQRLRQMDNEQLVKLVLQLRNRLNQVSKMQQQSQQPRQPNQRPPQGGQQRR